MEIQVAAQPWSSPENQTPGWHLKVQLSRGFLKNENQPSLTEKVKIFQTSHFLSKEGWRVFSWTRGDFLIPWLALHLRYKWITVALVLRGVINFFKTAFTIIFMSSWKLHNKRFPLLAPQISRLVSCPARHPHFYDSLSDHYSNVWTDISQFDWIIIIISVICTANFKFLCGNAKLE